MDHGPYNNDTRTPPTFSSFERYSIGWLRPEILTPQADTTNVLPALEESARAYLVEVPSKEHEYFLLENRQQEGWDTYLPNHGMLIWHIDYDSTRWVNNSPNNEPKQLVDIYEADGDYSPSTYAGDVMPGAYNITSLALYSWANELVTSPDFVRETADGTILFLLQGVNYSAAQPQTLQVSNLDAHGFVLSWDEVPDATSYRVIVNEGEAQIQNLEVIDTSVMLVELKPATTYSLQVVAYVGTFASQPATTQVTTMDLPFIDRTPTILPATDVQANSFVAHCL